MSQRCCPRCKNVIATWKILDALADMRKVIGKTLRGIVFYCSHECMHADAVMGARRKVRHGHVYNEVEGFKSRSERRAARLQHTKPAARSP